MSKGVDRTNTFVSKKISCVRWKPVARFVLTQSSLFVSGSWDDGENVLQLWQWSDVSDDPQCLHQLPCQHDFTCLTYVSPDVLAATTSGGNVTLYHHVADRLQPDRSWNGLHHNMLGPVPCTWLSAFEEELVTVGDDGRMNVLSVSSSQPTRIIDAADTCSMYRVQHITHSNVVTSNIRGQIKSWDLRSHSTTPTSSVMASQQQSPVTSLARHPTQYHVLASGDGDGVICIWDLRQGRYPVTELKSHSAEVSDLLFHRMCPDSLFSAAHDGSICQWNIGTVVKASISERFHGNKDASLGTAPTSWLTLDSSRRYLDVLSLLPTSPFPVNTLDLAGDRLVCGGDNEVLHCISRLTF